MNKPLTLTQGEQDELLDALDTITRFAAESRSKYEYSKEWVSLDGGSCMTIRVPTALLLRIRDVQSFIDQLKIERATGSAA